MKRSYLPLTVKKLIKVTLEDESSQDFNEE